MVSTRCLKIGLGVSPIPPQGPENPVESGQHYGCGEYGYIEIDLGGVRCRCERVDVGAFVGVFERCVLYLGDALYTHCDSLISKTFQMCGP